MGQLNPGFPLDERSYGKDYEADILSLGVACQNSGILNGALLDKTPIHSAAL